MNAVAPPPRGPKRAYGTGTISFHTKSATWRIRTPGGLGYQRAGFDTPEAAERALEDAMRGIDIKRKRRPRTTPRVLLRATLRYAIELADRNGLDLDDELRAMKGTP